MFSATAKWSWISGLACSAAAFGLFFAPPTVTSPLRTSVRDLLFPGQRLTEAAIDSARRVFPAYARVTKLQAELERVSTDLAHWQTYARHLESDVASLHETIDSNRRSGTTPMPPATEPPLMVADLLEARILGRESADQWRSGHLIDLGVSHGIHESAIVLSSTEPLLDQGTATRITPGQPVYSGRCVVGKTHHVGRWTSTVLPINDPEYRGFAQLVRRTDAADDSPQRTNTSPAETKNRTDDDDAIGTRIEPSMAGLPQPNNVLGPSAVMRASRAEVTMEDSIVFGAQGILEGNGTKLCRLTLIPSTEPVNVGENVCTGDRDGLFPYPMYYGKVVRAELEPNSPYWKILVKPAVQLDQLRMVSVLRKSMNPVRLADQ